MLKAKLALSKLEKYWWVTAKTRYWKLRLEFGRRRGLDFLNSARAGISIFTALGRSILGSMLVALALALLVQFLDPPRFLTLLATRYRLLIQPEAYSVLLETIASVVGVFLALYFAALSTVAGTVFNQVPNSVRDLLLRDKVGNLYVSLLSVVLGVALFLLAFQSLGQPPRVIASAFILLAALFSVFAFGRLGTRAFNFFDITRLADDCFKELRRLYREVASSSGGAAGRGFPAWYQKEAVAVVQTLGALIDLSKRDKNIRGEGPLMNLCRKLMWILEDYLRAKRRIPSNSGWFVSTPNYPQWYLSSYSQIDLAPMTGLQPKMEPDLHWLEERLLPLIGDICRIGIEEGRPVSVEILREYSELGRAFGSEWEVGFVRDHSESISRKVLDVLLAPKSVQSKDVSLALADQVAVFPINVMLGLRESVLALRVGTLSERLSAVDWTSEKQIDRLELPYPVTPAVAELKGSLAFEAAVEGSPVAPDWFILQIIAKAILEQLQTNVERWVNWTQAYYLGCAEGLRAGKRDDLAMVFCSRGIEACWKTRRYLEEFEEKVRELEVLRKVPSVPWVDFDWDKWKKSNEDSLTKLQEEMSRCIVGLFESGPSGNDMPDLLGEAVHRSGQACFESLAQNRAELFARLFPKYLIGILFIHERLTKRDQELSNLAPFAADAIMELVALSGYSYAWAEYHQNRGLWVPCEQTWSKYLARENGRERLDFVARAISYRESLFGLTPRDIVRAGWQRSLDSAIRTIPRRAIETFREMIFMTEPDHPSLLICLLGREELGSLYNGVDVFRCFYLKKHEKASGLDFGRDDLTESLERAERARGAENATN